MWRECKHYLPAVPLGVNSILHLPSPCPCYPSFPKPLCSYFNTLPQFSPRFCTHRVSRELLLFYVLCGTLTFDGNIKRCIGTRMGEKRKLNIFWGLCLLSLPYEYVLRKKFILCLYCYKSYV